MDAFLPALISNPPRTDGMERSELEHLLAGLHAESWGWALACCGRDRELGEEVLQTAYLRILSGRASFGGRSTFKTWLFGVIRWTARSETRRRRFWFARHADHSTASRLADPAISADMAIVLSDRRNRLVAALATLSPRQREVLQLVFYHDMTIEEASTVMHVSLGSARTHYERGKKALALRLAGEVDR